MTAVTRDIRIYVDLEYCYPGMTRTSGRPGSGDLRQVIQIAAIRYDHAQGREIESLDLIVRPPYTKQLPGFFTELTGITQHRVDDSGTDYPDALEQLVGFCRDFEVYTFDKDWEVLKQNCSYHDIFFPFADKPFVRIKPLLKEWGIDDGDYSSGTLYQAAGLHIEGRVHDALHDVRSMAAAVRALSNVRPG